MALDANGIERSKGATPWLIDLDRANSDYAVLATLAALALVGAVLFRVGLIGWVLRLFGRVVRGAIRRGFLVWERLLAWAPWPLFLAAVVALLVAGGVAAASAPGLTVVCAVALIVMGITACLAYMAIDLERYEVERGYKAVHNPVMGQELAARLVRYGHRVGIPLLASAAVGTVGGFALLNQGLYESVGRDWYRVGEGDGGEPAAFVDFLVNALLQLLRVVDVLDLASSRSLLRVTYIRQAAWPATALLAAFKTFFTLVLLQQVFASVRQGRLLAETIADFWSPHEPIHERARNSLPQFGSSAIRPLLVSLRSVASLTKEQRDGLPLIVAAIGPSTVPTLVRHLHDPHEHVRAVVVAALGHLHAYAAVGPIAARVNDPSEMVRQSAVEALGLIAGAGANLREKRKLGRLLDVTKRKTRRLLWWRRRADEAQVADPTERAVPALAAALEDASVTVRTHAAAALGRIGPAAAAAFPRLIALLRDADETARCQTAETLARVGGDVELTVAALVELLQDGSVAVRAAAVRALGELKKDAAPAVSSLVPLLQDPEELLRTAAAEAVAKIGTLGEEDTATLVEGLSSKDNVVRAQTAEALGTIGTTAEEAAPALVAAMKDNNDVVRAKAVEALGKIGEGAADVAVPGLVRALRDPDNWVSALAAEALGQMGDSADEAVPALTRSLAHVNPLVRANAAEALGKMGSAAARARPALAKACHDEDGAVRNQAVRALGLIGGTAAEEIRDALQDADPRVRAAAVEALGQGDEADDALTSRLLELLEDANDQVKGEVLRVLPKLAGAAPAVVEGLCGRLGADDSPWIKEQAALALGKLGPAAAAAGEPLLQAARTAEESVRVQAVRALALIQPPEAAQAFAAGLTDASGDVRKIASAAWMKADAIPEDAIPALVAALGDPENQVRANAAHALARLDAPPAEAVPRLIECAGDANDGLRMSAAMALARAPAEATRDVMLHLLADPSLRVRLIAAGSVLAADPDHAQGRAVLVEALGDPSLRVRKAAAELAESLGEEGAEFTEALKRRADAEEDSEVRQILARVLDRLAAKEADAPDGVVNPREGLA